MISDLFPWFIIIWHLTFDISGLRRQNPRRVEQVRSSEHAAADARLRCSYVVSRKSYHNSRSCSGLYWLLLGSTLLAFGKQSALWGGKRRSFWWPPVLASKCGSEEAQWSYQASTSCEGTVKLTFYRCRNYLQGSLLHYLTSARQHASHVWERKGESKAHCEPPTNLHRVEQSSWHFSWRFPWCSKNAGTPQRRRLL